MLEVSRKALFRVHAWIGLNLGFLLFVVCFSGTVAVFSAELKWLVDPAVRVTPPAAAEHQTIPWQEMHDRVARAYPHAMVLYLTAPRGERWAARVLIGYSQSDIRWVLVNPYTGEIQGQRSTFDLVSFFRIFHKQLYIVPVNLWIHGTLITGFLAVSLLIGTVAGLLSLKRWRRAFVTLRSGRSRRLFWSDLHRLTGVWALVITIVLSLTGIWYLAAKIMYDTGNLVEEAPVIRADTETLRGRPATLAPLALDEAVALARAAYPELVITDITLPLRPGDPLIFAGQAFAWLVRDRANQVQIDPYSGDVLDIRRAEELGPLARWIETADPLHFGTFAGLTSRIVWFVAGLFLCGAILAGLYGAWLRRQQKINHGQRRRLAAASAVAPTLVLLAASAYGTWTFAGDILRTAQRPLSVTPLMHGKLGPWQVSIVEFNPSTSASVRRNISIEFVGVGQPNFERAVFWFGEGESRTPARPARHLADRLLVRGACAGEVGLDQCRLNLRISEWRGTAHLLSVELRPPSKGALKSDLPAADQPGIGELVVIAAFLLGILAPLIAWIRIQVNMRVQDRPRG